MKKLRFVAALGFFTLTSSLPFFFFFSVPGPDPFYVNLAAVYFKSGFIDPTFFIHYAMPAYFLLVQVFSEVSVVPRESMPTIYVVVVGSIIPASIFLMARARQLDEFWAVVVCSILGVFAVSYQFAPHFLGVALLILLLSREVAKKSTASEAVLRVLLLACLAITHIYLGFFYAGYLLVLGLRDRTCVRRAALALLIVLGANTFLAAVAFPGVVGTAYTSLLSLWGLEEYRAAVTTTLTSSSPFQPLSRLSVLAAASISVAGLLGMIRKRIPTSREYALIIFCAILLGAGVGVSLIGLNSLQVAILPAGLGAGYFVKLIANRRLRSLVLILLALSSVFPVMHYYYDPQVQTQDDVAAAAFVSDHISTETQYGLYSPYMLRGYFYYLPTPTESASPWEMESRVKVGAIHDFIMKNQNRTEPDYVFLSDNVPILQRDPQSRDYLIDHANLICSYGNGKLFYWVK